MKKHKISIENPTQLIKNIIYIILNIHTKWKNNNKIFHSNIQNIFFDPLKVKSANDLQPLPFIFVSSYLAIT